jgi:hypothetical protein
MTTSLYALAYHQLSLLEPLQALQLAQALLQA